MTETAAVARSTSPVVVGAAIVVAIAFVLTGCARERARNNGPWCAIWAVTSTPECAFYSFEQCREAVAGAGGSCTRNPYLADDEPRKHPQRPR